MGTVSRAAVGVAAALALAGGAAVPAQAVEPFDFDGDRRQDVAVGMPNFQPRGAPDAGAVVLLRGLRPGHRVISQDTPGVPGVAEGDDAFGSALASADFDHDGFADLAVSAPREDLLYVVPGSRGGLAGARTTVIARAAGSLAAGDVDADGYADLVIGRTGEDAREAEDFGSGAVRLLFGGARGLSDRDARTLTRPRRADAGFGAVLALGDVDGDGDVDIVEGASGDAFWVDDPPVPGHLSFCPGTARGPVACRRIASGPPGPSSLAVADVTGDGRDDVVAGIPVLRAYTEDDPVPHGGVVLRAGTASGPGRPVTITQASDGVPGSDQRGDRFGAAVAAGRLDGDRFADLVIGAPGEDREAGRITVLRGGPRGYAAQGATAFGQGSRGVAGPARRAARFGSALALVDVNRDRRLEVAIGAPGGDRGNGAVVVLRGSRRGPAAGGSRAFGVRALGLDAPPAPQAFAPPFGSILGRAGSG